MTRGRHRDYLRQLAVQAEPHLLGTGQAVWLDRLETEHDNLRAALEWCRAADEEGSDLPFLAGALWPFWMIRGHLTEGRDWLEAAMGYSSAAAASTQARLLNGIGFLAFFQGDYSQQEAACEKALALAREVDDFQQVALALAILGVVAVNTGDLERGAALLDEGRRLSQECGPRWTLMFATNALGYVAMYQGDYERATVLNQESLALGREVGEHLGIAYSLGGLAEVELRQEEYSQAAAHHAEALRAFVAVRERRGIAFAVEGLAKIAQAQQQLERSARLFGAAGALREALGAPAEPADQPELDRSLAATRAALGEAAFAAAWQEGRAMPLDDAVAYALGETREG